MKQKELQPWTAQINSKRAEVDVATSERDALAKKAAVLKASSEEAEENLRTLQTDQQKNVLITFILSQKYIILTRSSSTFRTGTRPRRPTSRGKHRRLKSDSR